MNDKFVLAIDQSTQGTKALLINQNQKIVWKSSLAHKQIINEKGWISHDLNEIKSNLYKLFQDAIKQVDSESITSIAITNQRESAAAWSRKTGQALCHTLVWQDNRSADLVKKVSIPEIKSFVKNKTGLDLSSAFTGAKWAWMLLNEPQVIQANQNNDLALGTMDSWLLYQLTEGSSFKTELSNACRTQLVDIRTGNWDKKLCEIFGVDINSLPEIVDSNANFGETTLFGLSDHPIPIKSVLGDSQAALFAHNCFKPGDFKVTFGTGSSVMLNIGEDFPVNLDNRLNTSIAWKIDGKINYVIEGNITYAGACVTWLKDQLHLIKTPEETEKLALTANPHDQTYLIPAFTGLSAPYLLSNIRAAFVGMTATTGKAELVRATLNSLVYQINDIINEFSHLSPHINNQIHTDGGMIHNKYLMQYLSNITQRQVDVASVSELSAMGSTLNALNQHSNTESSENYKPRIEQTESDKITKAWSNWINKLA